MLGCVTVQTELVPLTRRHSFNIPEDLNLQKHHCENLKSCKLVYTCCQQ